MLPVAKPVGLALERADLGVGQRIGGQALTPGGWASQHRDDLLIRLDAQLALRRPGTASNDDSVDIAFTFCIDRYDDRLGAGGRRLVAGVRHLVGHRDESTGQLQISGQVHARSVAPAHIG